ncbi:MAG: serine/threonine protein kinase [Planctomycetes bacterium]|nr:serine/threonine protein kinase [Planctomycetota bacterium]
MHSQQPESHSDPTQHVGATVHEHLPPPTPEQGPATAPLVRETQVDSKDAPTAVQPPAPMLEEPLLFERYKPIGPPLPGGMGKVYKVRDTTLGHIVALKTMRSALLGQPTEVERFKREARAVAQLKHENIITIHHFDVYRGEPFFTMEFMEGGSLASRLSEFTKKDPAAIAALMEKVARAVGVAHSKDIIHRDLKPGNILLDPAGEPKVSDFGLAKFLKEQDDITRPEQRLGTWYYMSPEQATRDHDILSPATDVWSLGVIFYELLTGKKPFDGETKKQLTNAICKKEPLPPRVLRKGFDRGLEAIVGRCLSKDPEQRYQRAGELAEELIHWRQGEAVATPNQTPFARRRRPWKKTALALGLLAMILLVAFLQRTSTKNDSTGAVQDRNWTDEIEKELKGKKQVTLIAETGGPKGYDLIRGAGKIDTDDDPSRPFSVNAWDLAMLELVANRTLDHFRFEAEVRHLASSGSSLVGIYLAQSRQPTDQGVANLYLEWSFNDFPEFAAHKGEWDHEKAIILSGKLLREPEGPRGPATIEIYPGHGKVFKVGKPREVPWRKIAVEVSSKGVIGSWEGEKVGQQRSWAEVNAMSKKILTMILAGEKKLAFLKSLEPSFGPRQGLGLLVHNGTAQFRNVRVTPITD